MLQLMDIRNIYPDSIAYTALLAACAEAGDIQAGRKIHNRLTASRTKLESNLFSSLINMYTRCNDVQTAISLWSQTTLPPTRSLYVSLLTACGNIKDVDLAHRIHQKLIRDGFVLDTVLATALLNMYAKLGDKDQVLAIWDDMQTKGIPANSVTYICLLTLASSTKDIHLGQKVYNIINGSLQDASLCTALIKMYASCEQPQLVVPLWRDITAAGHTTFDQPLYLVMASVCADLEDLGLARQVHAHLETHLRPPKSNSIRNALASMYHACGDSETAFSLWYDMLRGDKLDQAVYVSMLSASAAAGDSSLGLCVRDHIARTGYYVDEVIASSTLRMFVQCGEITSAIEIWEYMDQQGMVSNELTYLCLLHAAVNTAKNFSLVLRVHDHINSAGVIIGSKLQTMLVHAYSYYGHYQKALDLFTEGNTNEGAEITVHQWAVIINACGKFKKGREALGFFNQMISSGTQPNDVLLVSILFATLALWKRQWTFSILCRISLEWCQISNI